MIFSESRFRLFGVTLSFKSRRIRCEWTRAEQLYLIEHDSISRLISDIKLTKKARADFSTALRAMFPEAAANLSQSNAGIF
jgi:hypothetical protein